MEESYHKLSSLLELIKSVDGPRIKSPLSDYNTVMDIRERIKTGSNLTSSQINLIKDIKNTYIRKNG